MYAGHIRKCSRFSIGGMQSANGAPSRRLLADLISTHMSNGQTLLNVSGFDPRHNTPVLTCVRVSRPAHLHSHIFQPPTASARPSAWQKTLAEWVPSEHFLPRRIMRGGFRSLSLIQRAFSATRADEWRFSLANRPLSETFLPLTTAHCTRHCTLPLTVTHTTLRGRKRSLNTPSASKNRHAGTRARGVSRSPTCGQPWTGRGAWSGSDSP